MMRELGEWCEGFLRDLISRKKEPILDVGSSMFYLNVTMLQLLQTQLLIHLDGDTQLVQHLESFHVYLN